MLGLDVLPEYRMQGLARAIVSEYADREKKKGRKMLVLTCLDEKVKMYEKMGFIDCGMSNSAWSGEAWHEMRFMNRVLSGKNCFYGRRKIVCAKFSSPPRGEVARKRG